MSLDQDFMQQLRLAFAVEAQEHLQTLSRDLLTLEQQAPAAAPEPLLAEIFRAAHSLKGAARAVGLENVAIVAHHLEDILGQIRSGAPLPHPGQFDLLYRALDVLTALVAGADGDAALAQATVDLVAQLEHFGATAALAPLDAQPAPALRAESEPTLTTPVPPPAPAVAPPPRPVGAANALDETVRVTTAKLDAIMEQVGELQVVRLNSLQQQRRLRALLEDVEHWRAAWRKRHAVLWSANGAVRPAQVGSRLAADSDDLREQVESVEQQLGELARNLRDLWRDLDVNHRRTGQLVESLDEHVRRTRLMPVGVVFEAFPRMVRDLARTLDKQVRLVIEGAETEVDRAVLELIKDPLTHLLRNAVDHGIEAPAQRVAAGKPSEGVIRLRAGQRGDMLLIEVIDDGAGIDPERLRASAVRHGILRGEEAAGLNEHDAYWLIFRSGFSTRTQVTDVSGRGVGMDVVREHVERLHGMVDVDSKLGQGTHFKLFLPLTVATTLCLLAQVNGRTFALPAGSVARIWRVLPDEFGHAEGRTVLKVDGHPLTTVALADLLQLEAEQGVGPAATQYAVVLAAGDKRFVVLVDTVADVQELVLKSLPKPWTRVRNVAGAAIMGTGEVVIVLNVADLLYTINQPGSLAGRVRTGAGAPAVAQAPLILVVDDSFTTRTLEKNILETAGYRVTVAADGLEAWTLLQGDSVDLVVSDVMMPRMTGFELTSKLRNDARLKHLPVILVTAQESREDRERGVAVGADAYIVKSAFDQDSLLNTIQRFLS
jgi:two-component system chemotaxis sensor kinase CheA